MNFTNNYTVRENLPRHDGEIRVSRGRVKCRVEE
jgi:hypothetical protein